MGVPAQDAAEPKAGQVSAIVPGALRNSVPAKNKEDIRRNDVLRTENQGRLRVRLEGGTVLSLGPESELRLAHHDEKAQQTDLDLAHGRLRSRVVQVNKKDGRFAVRTPVAVVDVVGTDFFVNAGPDRTLVICYSGSVRVAPNGGKEPKVVPAGQMVDVTRDAVGELQAVSDKVREDSIAQTAIDKPDTKISKTKRNFFIAAIAAAVATVVALVARDDKAAPATQE
jgi:hypothetical protein